MAQMIRSLLLIGILSLCAASVEAEPLSNEAYAGWVHDLEVEAIANGISSATVHSALDFAMLDDRVVTLDQKQPETTITFDAYSARIITPERIEDGRRYRKEDAALLADIEKRYGVPSGVVIALWGIESRFGHNSGSYSVIDSLVTLAYEGRRADFFRKELINALRILDQEHISPASLRGSWAGAMGQCQFMPSTYLNYAVDYNNTGLRDIWSNTADVFASIANYLASEGWRPDENWGQEVEVQGGLPPEDIGLDNKFSLSEWNALGVRRMDGSALPDRPLQASLIQPDGADGRSFLVYDNFRALMRWNHSTYFATTVGLLADQIGKGQASDVR